jgi:uncharacterized protein
MAESIQPVLNGCPDIVAAYVFGSTATGSQRPGSDIDIAVLLAEGRPFRDRKALLDRLLPPLSRVLRGDVHILFLNDASCVVQAQVLSKGQLIYVRDRRQLAEFRMKSISMMADFAPYVEMTRKGLQKRMRDAHGG